MSIPNRKSWRAEIFKEYSPLTMSHMAMCQLKTKLYMATAALIQPLSITSLETNEGLIKAKQQQKFRLKIYVIVQP